MTKEEWSEFCAFCGGSGRVAAHVSVKLQKRAGLKPDKERMPDLSLLSKREKGLVQQGVIPW